jgi:cytochrome o ubiquinol oxidase operon protein cyoD
VPAQASIWNESDSASHDDGSKTTAGFWIYLMSDCLIFAVLFATFDAPPAGLPEFVLALPGPRLDLRLHLCLFAGICMSTNHHHPAQAGHASSHGSIKSYTIGLALSVLLTLASFGVVMTGVVPHHLRLPAIVVLCVVQLLVQLVYFLHLGTRKDQRENTAVFICTGLIIVIVVAGSLWVMHNANVNMMPTNMSVEGASMHE